MRTVTLVIALTAVLSMRLVPVCSGAALSEADQLMIDGEFAAAESIAVLVLDGLEHDGRSGSGDAAHCLYLIGQARFKQGDAAGADDWLRRSIETYDGMEAPQDSALMPVLQTRGDVLIELYRPDDAFTVYDRRRRIAIALGGEDAVELTGAHYSMGVARYYGGNFNGALEEFSQALEMAQHRWGSESIYAAYCQNMLGTVQDEIGQFVDAKNRYQEVVRIVQAQEEPDRLFLASTLNNLGWTLRNLGDYEESKLQYEEALRIRKELVDPPDPNIASTLGNLADLYRETGDLATAERYASEALDMRVAVYGAAHPVVATNLEFLGALHIEADDPGRARDEFRRCLDIRLESFDDTHPDVALARSELAGALRLTGDLEGAREELATAIPALEAGFTELHPNVTRAYLERARVEARSGDAADAFATALEAERRSREHLRLASGALPERLALRYSGERVSGQGLLLALCEHDAPGERVRAAWDAVIRTRALVLDEMAARNQAVRALDDPRTARLAGDLNAARERLAHVLVAGADPEHPQEFQRRLRTAQAEVAAAEEALAGHSEAAAENLRRSGLGLREIVRELGDGEALVGFVRYEQEREEARYAAFIADAKDVTFTPLGPASALEAAVRRWEDAIRSGAGDGAGSSEAEYGKAALELRRIVWDPLAGRLASSRRVYLVPDGALHRVSFASLPAENGKYLAEEDPVLEYLSAERDLVPGAAPTPEGGDILLVGDPDFDAAAGSQSNAVPENPEAGAIFGCGGLKGVRFEALAATREEVRDVRAIWEESDSPAISELTGSQATERAVKARIPGARVVHLATHGFVLDGTCGKRIKNSRGIQSYSRRRSGREGPRANPLQLAGLALAGANLRERAAPEDDGILTAEELSSLDLSAADLVVLSACETGLGRIEATEGVVGIRRSLQIAGAGNLIMSLWAVEDTSTREWMADLYHALLKEGVDVPGAVQRAQRARIAAGRKSDHGAHPFFWAGFVSSGASRQGRFDREERRSR